MKGHYLLAYGIIGLAWMIVKIIAGLLTAIYVGHYLGLSGMYLYSTVIVVWMIICRAIISDKFPEHYEQLVDEYSSEHKTKGEDVFDEF